MTRSLSLVEMYYAKQNHALKELADSCAAGGKDPPPRDARAASLVEMLLCLCFFVALAVVLAVDLVLFLSVILVVMLAVDLSLDLALGLALFLFFSLAASSSHVSSL